MSNLAPNEAEVFLAKLMLHKPMFCPNPMRCSHCRPILDRIEIYKWHKELRNRYTVAA